jgi:hypothetical protein
MLPLGESGWHSAETQADRFEGEVALESVVGANVKSRHGPVASPSTIGQTRRRSMWDISTAAY